MIVKTIMVFFYFIILIIYNKYMNNNSFDNVKKINTNDKDSNIFSLPGKKDKKLNNINDFEEYSLDVINGKILSKIDSNSNFINELTVSNIAYNYVKYLVDQNLKNKNILVTSDANFDATVFSQVFASALIANNINVFFSPNNQPINASLGFSQMDESFGGMVTFCISNIKKNILLISFFDTDGSLLSHEKSISFNGYISNTEELSLEIYDKKIETLKTIDIDKYFSSFPTAKDLSNIKVSINNSYEMNGEVLSYFFKRNNISYKESKCSKPSRDKNIKKSIFNSVRKKDDIALSFLSDNNNFELAILHKNQYKLFNLNDLSAIYLFYLLKYCNYDKEYFNDKYIVTSISSGYLSSIIAKKHSIKVKQYENFSSSISMNNDLNSKMIFATNGANYFINKNNQNYVTDPLYNMQLFLTMTSFFKEQNKTLYDVMEEITLEYGTYRFSELDQNIDDTTIRKLFNIIEKEMVFADKKIIRYEKINTDNKNKKIVRIIFEDKTKATFIYYSKINSLKIYLSLYFGAEKENLSLYKKSSNLNNNYIDLVVEEKKIIEHIKIFKDNFTKKQVTWKDYLKYLVFTSVLISIFIILFFTLYKAESGNTNIFNQLYSFITHNKLFKYLLPIIIMGIIFPIICNSILIGRMLKSQGEKVKIRHLITSSIIGIVISAITPMSIGGDLAGYWYLRRKSFERGPLIATYLASSLLYQITGAITSVIFIPMGFIAFKDTLNFNSPDTIFILILILIGFIGNIIGASFIGVFSFSKRAQNIFINIWIKIIDWIPFFVSRDPKSRVAIFQYEFSKIRKSSKLIFKNFFSTTEFLFWRMLPFFVNLSAILAIFSGTMKPNDQLWGGQYINYMIASSLLGAANAISITPGGAGTSQWLQAVIFEPMFQEKNQSTIFSLLSTIVFFIIPVIISAFLLLTVWIGEKRIDKYGRVKRVIQYETETKQNKNIRKYTRFYKISSIFWTIGFIAIMAIYYSLI